MNDQEREAQAVNCTASVDGYYTWKCEQCGDEWKEKDDGDYDRTKDHTNWPVICEGCQKFYDSDAG